MNSGHLSRRQFLGTSAVGGAALAMGLKAAPAFAQNSDAVRFGVIGTGGRARYLLQRIADRPDIRIAALCDLKREAIDKTMEIVASHKPNTYLDFRQMLDREKLDGVLVVTRPHQHAEVSVPVLEAGYNVFCEKPLDTTVESVDQFTQAARKAKGICQIGMQRRYKTGYVEAIDKIHRGAIGNIRFIEGYWKWTWKLGEGWVSDVEQSGGELVEQAVHHMDVAAWLMKQQQPVRAVSIGGVMRQTESVVEDHSATTFEFPNGVKFQYTHLFHLGTPKFSGELLRAYGETGGAELRRDGYFGTVGQWKAYDGEGNETVLSEGNCDHEEGTLQELISFARHCRTGEKPACNIEVARLAALMGIMGRTAMFDRSAWKFNPRVIEWKDLGTTTDPA